MKKLPSALAGAAFTVLLCGLLPAQQKDLYDPDTVRDLYLTFAQTDYWTQLRNNKASETNIKANLVVDNVTYKDVGVRFRGQTSYSWLPSGSEKIGFNIDTDAFVTGQTLLGYDSLNLNNGFHDPSFMREFLTYMLTRRYGPAPKCNFVRLWINNTYWGIYINVQQPDKDMMKEWFRNPDGNRYRAVPFQPFTASALTWRGTNVQSYVGPYQFKKGDGTDLVSMINVLNNTATNQLQAELPKIWSVDTSFWYFACMNIMVHEDCYIGSGKDHFHYHDPLHGTFHIMPFDVNESWDADGRYGTSFNIYINQTSANHPAISKTFQFADWKARYVAHYRTVLEETFNWKDIGGLVTKYQALIAADVAKDTKKLYTTQQFTDNATKAVVTVSGRLRATVPGLQPFVEARVKYLQGLTDLTAAQPTLTDLTQTPKQPSSADTVFVTAKAGNASKVTLFSRAKGPFQETAMLDDGKHNDGAANDGVYGASIAAQAPGTQIDYYVGAVTSAGVMRFLPRSAEFRSPNYVISYPTGSSPIKINEIMAKNNSTIKDEGGEFADWVELVNTSAQAVSVSGMHLTDDPTNPTKWVIPVNQTIAAKGSLLIWLDEDPTQGPLHANFKLSTSGEEIRLFASDGKTQLDALVFGEQQADIATGRLVDGGSPFVTLLDPTPKASNENGECGVRRFSALDSTRHRLALSLVGTPKLGSTVTLALSKGPANGAAGLYVAGGAGYLEIGQPGAVILLNPAILVGQVVLGLDAQGAANPSVKIPNIPAAAGMSIFAQVFATDSAGFTASNAVDARLCK